MYLYGLICGVAYMGLKLLVRWVWYRPEHLRPGFVRHYFVIRALDFAAMIFLAAAFFLFVNAVSLPRTGMMIGALVLYDLILRSFFLHLEAHRICVRSPRWTMKDAKRRLRRRAKQETPF